MRFYFVWLSLVTGWPLWAQFSGPVAAPVPVPSLSELQAQLTLAPEQGNRLAPLLAQAAALHASIATHQTAVAQLHEALPAKLAPLLDDSQRQALPMALFRARVGSGPPPSSDQPAPRTDDKSRRAHERLLAKRTQGRIDLYFMGDSITRRWGATDYPDFLAHWKSTFSGWQAANFGWGGDTLPNILWRLDHGELDGVHPKVIVFMGGTNNIGERPGDDAQAHGIAQGIKAVLARFQQKAPGATVILTGILPRGSDPAMSTFIRKINTATAALADGSKVRYLDLFPRYLNREGELNKDAFTPDQLHLALPGYQIWAEALTPLLTELLGARASVDHAPPPTGDD
jgi:lysophospholipase L1-like esterase